MKNIIIRSLITLFLLSLSPTLFAEEGVVLLLNDGTSVGFAFSQKPDIAIGSELTISTADGKALSYDYSSIKRISFADITPTAIDNIKSSSAKAVFSITDNGIEVSGLANGEKVRAYSVDGSLAASATARDGHASLQLSSTGSVYIIRTSGGVTFKFVH